MDIQSLTPGLNPFDEDAKKPASPKALGFAELIQGAIERANATQKDAEFQTSEIARGEGDVLEGVLSVTRAESSLRYLLTLRNRMLEAYQEILRIQV